ncbi:MAG: cytochrome d ubiquinol oxidase subunit II [Cellulomonadaceae bacterium]|jgi:cytochrome d ubiquinol oxidase subunit II|nr:cytochrome d ubiquinol oxidase subunit II [Cellulomonadaceae bacterium]
MIEPISATLAPSALQILWFILIAVLWTGYLVLEGFDFGVGMLLNILPRGNKEQKEVEKRLLINTIGPVWDGNEVWLLTAGGATFAAFPYWYATLFSGFYLALLLILVALIFRGVAFEYRGAINDAGWRQKFDWCLAVGAWLPALLWGVAFGNLVRGVALEANAFGNLDYNGGLFPLLNPFSIVGGLTTLVLFLLHGSVFVALKTDGDMRDRANALAGKLGLVAIVVAGGWAIWAQLAYGKAWTWIAVAVAALALVAAVLANKVKREGWAFFFSALVMPAAVALIFGSMYPYAIPGLGDGEGLSLMAASSTNYTLTVMTVVACIFTPIVLAYTAWTYWIFRRRLSTKDIPPPHGLSLKVIKEAAFGKEAPPAAPPVDAPAPA